MISTPPNKFGPFRMIVFSDTVLGACLLLSSTPPKIAVISERISQLAGRISLVPPNTFTTSISIGDTKSALVRLISAPPKKHTTSPPLNCFDNTDFLTPPKIEVMSRTASRVISFFFFLVAHFVWIGRMLHVETLIGEPSPQTLSPAVVAIVHHLTRGQQEYQSDSDHYDRYSILL